MAAAPYCAQQPVDYLLPLTNFASLQRSKRTVQDKTVGRYIFNMHSCQHYNVNSEMQCTVTYFSYKLHFSSHLQQKHHNALQTEATMLPSRTH